MKNPFFIKYVFPTIDYPKAYAIYYGYKVFKNILRQQFKKVNIFSCSYKKKKYWCPSD